ncbi:hypothetical protein WR25_15243 [Diploscapter pachys]|uniref:Protein-tyrosine-phosphatase n=1 Tax=Diploscapter pachys TaxID=2018661 RepID=A0A2A2LUR6_9BILA|nr:hypothetical protein WR25_15243 [Diploscapter pachys]
MIYFLCWLLPILLSAMAANMCGGKRANRHSGVRKKNPLSGIGPGTYGVSSQQRVGQGPERSKKQIRNGSSKANVSRNGGKMRTARSKSRESNTRSSSNTSKSYANPGLLSKTRNAPSKKVKPQTDPSMHTPNLASATPPVGSKNIVLNRKDNRVIWAERTAKLVCKDISLEFERTIKKYKAPGQTYKACENNEDKNRYADVICCDETRVVLKDRANDYIHASYVQVPNGGQRYICTQGPLPETFEDFWTMVYQEKTKFVIMLCKLCEDNTQKCDKYYPDAKKKKKETYGSITVSLIETKPQPAEEATWNVLSVEPKGKPPFEVYHVQVPNWPDQLAPVDAKPMLNLYKWVKKINPKGSTILVHCSAGVGRTATFVGIDYAIVMIQENESTMIGDVIKEIRKQRYQAIQSHVQFLFLHICIFELFIEEGVIHREGAVADFIRAYQNHAEKKIKKKDKETQAGQNKERQFVREETMEDLCSQLLSIPSHPASCNKTIKV